MIPVKFRRCVKWNRRIGLGADDKATSYVHPITMFATWCADVVP